MSPLDWSSHASRRVVTSTVAAETSASMEALGRAMYLRALMCEVKYGRVKAPHLWSEQDMKIVMITDCKSLYDNVQKECSLFDFDALTPFSRGKKKSTFV